MPAGTKQLDKANRTLAAVHRREARQVAALDDLSHFTWPRDDAFDGEVVNVRCTKKIRKAIGALDRKARRRGVRVAEIRFEQIKP